MCDPRSFWIWMKRKEGPEEMQTEKENVSANFASIARNRKRKVAEEDRKATESKKKKRKMEPAPSAAEKGTKRRKEHKQPAFKESKNRQEAAAPPVHFNITHSVRAFIPRGTTNLGNTCFINSSLQAIATFQEKLQIPLRSHLSVALAQALLDLPGK